MLALALLACTDTPRPAVFETAFPAPDAFAPPAGPGGPARSFAPDELLAPCGVVQGGPGDAEHHNLSVMWDGWLVHPWAPEDGGGGVSFLAFDDPCAPEVVGQAWADGMRETHTLAFGEAQGRDWLAVDYLGAEPGVGGVGFWDVTDRAAPFWASELATPEFYYPDSYLRVTFSSFWQGPWLFVAAALNGMHVVDVSDPEDPVLVTTVELPSTLVGSVTVVGNVAVVASATAFRTVLLDVSDPTDPQPIPGGTFDTVDEEGDYVKYYFSSVAGRYGLFARNDRVGGPIVWDLADPAAPVQVGSLETEGGDGGYVYRQGDRLFEGDSNFAIVADFSDPTAPVELARLTGPGDLDTLSPIGNVAVLSVDSGGAPGAASTVIPWAEAPDADPPALEWHVPADGATGQALTTRIGLSFDEWIERASVFEGSFRVADEDGRPVEGTFNVQEAVANFTPARPLRPSTRYLVSVPAGGVTDVSGNPVAADRSFAFTTGAE